MSVTIETESIQESEGIQEVGDPTTETADLADSDTELEETAPEETKDPDTVFVFSVSASDLRSALGLVGKAIDNRSSFPVLACVYLDFRDGSLQLTGNNLSLGIQVQMSGEFGDTTAPLCIPFDALNKLVAKIPANTLLTCQVNVTALNMAMTFGRSSFSFELLNAEHYPLPEAPSEWTLEGVNAAPLLEALSMTSFSMSNDRTKAALAGIHLCPATDGTQVAATDGHRLSKYIVPELAIPSPVTIPAEGIPALMGLLKDVDELTIIGDHAWIGFVANGMAVYARTIADEFPDVNRLFPAGFERTITFDRAALIILLERVMVFSSVDKDVLTFTAGADDLAVQVTAAGVGNCEDSLPVLHTAAVIPFKFALRGLYFLQALKAISTSEVQIKANGDTQPMVIIGLGKSEYEHMLMPVKIRA